MASAPDQPQAGGGPGAHDVRVVDGGAFPQEAEALGDASAGGVAGSGGDAADGGRAWHGVTFLRPGTGQELSFEDLSLLSRRLAALCAGGHLDRDAIADTRAMAVCPGDVLGRGLHRSAGGGHPLPAPGRGASLGTDGQYRAERYGYVCLEQGALSVRSPLLVDEGQQRVHWLLLDPAAQPVTAAMLARCLDDLGVAAGVQWAKLVFLIEAVAAGRHKRGVYLVARGTAPVDGRDAHLRILVALGHKAGRERPDGSIDFREVNFAPSVARGQLLARRRPPAAGRPGTDIYGRALPAREGQDRPLRPGDNVELRHRGQVEEFYARVEGVTRCSGEVLSVCEVLAIGGDVDFHTGNLRFEGDICVSGSVAQGFSVHADADLTIAGTVEAGAWVSAGGLLVVGQGIVGRKTFAEAGGGVRAQYVQEATVRSGGDITLGSYVYHARLYAAGAIDVLRGEGPRGGCIMGGQAWAGRDIAASTAGTENGMASVLVAGLDPEHAHQLDRVERSIGATSQQIERLLDRFDLRTVDAQQIRNRIRAATGPGRSLLARRARQLGQLAQAYQSLLERRRQLRHSLGGSEERSEIRISDRVHPGVEIRVGEHRRQLTDAVRAPRFHVRDGRLVTA